MPLKYFMLIIKVVPHSQCQHKRKSLCNTLKYNILATCKVGPYVRGKYSLISWNEAVHNQYSEAISSVCNKITNSTCASI